jgi:hypothetical protein
MILFSAIGCAPKPATVLTGRDEAERDVSRGTLKLYLYGEPTAAHAKFAELFGGEKIRGTVEQLGAAKLTDDQDQRIQDYNRYVLQELSRRHGPRAVPTLCDRSGLTLDHILHEHHDPSAAKE